MKDQKQFLAKVNEDLTKRKKEFEATNDELAQVVGYALDQIRTPATPSVTITDQKAYDEGKKNPAPPPPEPGQETKPETKSAKPADQHKPAEHKK